MSLRAFFVTICLGLLSACGGTSAPAAKDKAKPKTAAESDDGKGSGLINTVVPYSYAPMGKRDPFRSPVEEVREVNATCNEPLCQWDLDQLSLVAVVTGDASPIAMVEDGQGRGYIVRRNSKVGKQGGKVTQILRDTVTVTEYWKQPDGKLSPNPVSLQLKKGTEPVMTAQDLSLGKEL